MKELCFVTITGINHYYGKKPFKIDTVVKLQKDIYNEYDCEAIAVLMPAIDKVGYVANSANTVFAGTMSAGRIYDKFEDFVFARVMFITHSSVIALIIDESADNCSEESHNDNDERINNDDLQHKQYNNNRAVKKETIGFKA